MLRILLKTTAPQFFQPANIAILKNLQKPLFGFIYLSFQQ